MNRVGTRWRDVSIRAVIDDDGRGRCLWLSCEGEGRGISQPWF